MLYQKKNTKMTAVADFGNLRTDGGLAKLNEFMSKYSYVNCYNATEDDVICMQKVSCAPLASKYPHANRWFNHINKFSEQKCALLPTGKISEQKKEAKKDEDEEFDLFGDDTEEDKEALKKLQEKKKDVVAEKKKKVVVCKSNVIFDIKPCFTKVKLSKLAELVKGIKMEGLIWGSVKTVPLAFGVEKLQMSCAIEDEKVPMEILTEKIYCVGMLDEQAKAYLEKREAEQHADAEDEEDEEEDEGDEEGRDKNGCFIQSVDIAAFNKI